MKELFDYLIVGSGISGATFAYEASQRGKKCLVLEKREHIGGNIYNIEKDGILIHRYGAHIFHTSDREIWEYICQFCDFNHFINSPIANYKGELYNLPFNMNTFYGLWGITTPKQAKEKIESECLPLRGEAKNLEEQALSLVGSVIYEKLIQGYTEKQWGKVCTQLPAFILKRLPLRFTYDNNYFDDPYQGIPTGGYTELIEKMLFDCEVRTNTDYFSHKKEFDTQANKVFYTGMIDKYFNFSLGRLEYRSLKFEDTYYDLPNYQGVAVVNYTDRETPYTRSIEHKHFQFGQQAHTIVTREYPVCWTDEAEPYYPINDEKNQQLYEKYHELGEREEKVMFCGRLAQYRYCNMDEAVKNALELARRELGDSSLSSRYRRE